MTSRLKLPLPLKKNSKVFCSILGLGRRHL
jgi:hypothetical protein